MTTSTAAWVFVVTDFDLTKGGMRGFQGPAVQNWCQRRIVPVADFSRRRSNPLTKEPDLFQIRIPLASDEVAVAYIEAVFAGFRDIRAALQPPSRWGDEAYLPLPLT